ncbi:hypothetical protein [Sulfuracidifex tepidarius]|uniref:Uncharacterized protein n=1 Tax=Sulfuracidifex tepidarius TaxID=1294262 RepID=A0A510DU52_9CREN|nr:hypothetical protein [Sulfuracidifex tepidarius]BBG23699.1 hypothetical protein IC006_0989 [Sulfuracidifex tepidarius]BBG26451.1 hypothetical protein IC007_0961 [Sulfuracidifex tepidarius]
MKLNPGEQVVWREFPMSVYRRNVTIALTVIGVLFLFSGFFYGLGIFLIALALVMYSLTRSASQYLVTNERAMLLRFGKATKEVPLNTPNLLVSTVNQQFISSKVGGNHVVQDVIFLQNGMELLRFKKVHKGEELIAILHSMGFT